LRRHGERSQNFAHPIALAIASATSVSHSRPNGNASEIRSTPRLSLRWLHRLVRRLLLTRKHTSKTFKKSAIYLRKRNERATGIEPAFRLGGLSHFHRLNGLNFGQNSRSQNIQSEQVHQNPPMFVSVHIARNGRGNRPGHNSFSHIFTRARGCVKKRIVPLALIRKAAPPPPESRRDAVVGKAFAMISTRATTLGDHITYRSSVQSDLSAAGNRFDWPNGKN
jgi:hypothetical protein